MAGLTEQFIIEAEAVKSGVHVTQTAEVVQIIKKLVGDVSPEKIYDTRHQGAIERAKLAQMEIGISDMVAGIADTGSLIVDLSRSDHLVSLLPQSHIAIVREADLFGTLSDYLTSGQAPLRYTQITGPSKTADIEKVLVYGAHGPVRLDIVLIRNEQKLN